MQFYDVVENRKSIKKFKTNTLDKDKINRMINAAMMSPSWKNQTCYKFILVDDDNKKQSIANAIMNNTNEATQSVMDAPMTAVVVAEPDASGAMEGKEYYLVDSAIAMEHFVLAATQEGYGTCWIASFDERKIKDILSIPDHFRVVALTPVGEIAAEKPKNPPKDVREYVFLNEWNRVFADQDTKIIIHH
ncbi:nitroreductase family protein [Clostridium ganghwense]|uniref:Nitroreductase family protein n=1 Tax=Clostridium ganghwense TaxID=312089 RepID=A0ABT4CN57_9CLOT|nr:nitroreductase family protein [Clostridium ganghwense]MCY6370491.1 nitroreductase family protein [Clostridium ganghwense]